MTPTARGIRGVNPAEQPLHNLTSTGVGVVDGFNRIQRTRRRPDPLVRSIDAAVARAGTLSAPPSGPDSPGACTWPTALDRAHRPTRNTVSPPVRDTSRPHGTPRGTGTFGFRSTRPCPGSNARRSRRCGRAQTRRGSRQAHQSRDGGLTKAASARRRPGTGVDSAGHIAESLVLRTGGQLAVDRNHRRHKGIGPQLAPPALGIVSAFGYYRGGLFLLQRIEIGQAREH
jgi:hypothetical protein